MMADRLAALGVRLRTATTVTALAQDAMGVTVTLSDGTEGRYDLVIGADGLFSATRGMILPEAPLPRYTGQICWRAQLPLPPDWTSSRMYVGPMKIGFTPSGPKQIFLYVLDNVARKPRYAEADILPNLVRLLAPFPALSWLRDRIDAQTPITVPGTCGRE